MVRRSNFNRLDYVKLDEYLKNLIFDCSIGAALLTLFCSRFYIDVIAWLEIASRSSFVDSVNSSG